MRIMGWVVSNQPSLQAGFVRRPVANDLLFSGMKKEAKKTLRLLMLLWKNYVEYYVGNYVDKYVANYVDCGASNKR